MSREINANRLVLGALNHGEEWCLRTFCTDGSRIQPWVGQGWLAWPNCDGAYPL
jgi:hypothetical protein